MFSFFKRKKPVTTPENVPAAEDTPASVPEAASGVETASPEHDAVEAIAPAARPDPLPLETPQPMPSVSETPSPEIVPVSPPAAVPGNVSVALPDVPSSSASTDATPSSAPVPAPDAGALAQVEPLQPPAAPPEPEAPRKISWMARLKQGLSKTGQSLGNLFVGVKVDENLYEELETALIMADAGVEATNALLTELRGRVRKERLTEADQVKAALRDILTDHLKPLEKSFPADAAKPLVIMIAGVNGAGKTTSIGKLANTFQRQGKSVLLAAGDTFRAAAREQLVAWGARNNVNVIAQDGGDPAAVAFDAVNAGRARGSDVVMVDTAGRLPTQLHLMEELKKIRRVIGKAESSAPHEVLLVVDGNTGQNVIAQIRAFDAAINLTGLVVTKLDGTAKGGTLAAVAAGSQGVRPVPVYWIGVGEGLEDLQPFVASEFASALLG
ncbi:MAG: signal recognition particle-docking protein FtsY [Pusillimonas sp.]